jgi:glyoxylase-like metal-dependent hydrolase (beta-lactamase superfamily II)
VIQELSFDAQAGSGEMQVSSEGTRATPQESRAAPEGTPAAPEGTGPTWGTRGIRGWDETSYPLVASLPQEILPGIYRILAPNPGLFTGPGTNTYVIRSGGEAVVIDPGPPEPRHIEAVNKALAGVKCTAILLSHHHIDHAEGATAFRERFGAPLAGFPLKLDVDIALEDGSVISVSDDQIRVIHTPGHASDHLCFFYAGQVALTGDHLMGGNTSVIAPPDGNMKEYMESLAKLEGNKPNFALPGHGQPLPEPLAAIRWYIDHRLDREKSIVDLLASNEAGRISIPEIVEALYTDIPQPARKVAEYSVWAHLEKLEDEGKAEIVDGEGIGSFWRLSRNEHTTRVES